ncbi:kelch-like protein 12 [Xenia sp. Carnegie-2017]|uniref:kelch-like protein 12 n=1 Tax=Xenia sp. Carnegie-2017 TaxID=2897299 RepID=UPI001F03EF96|nr:kelch-like protein 12 [Xenia sp. Carnegie-2017]
MAYRPNDYECGYDESRFKNAVDENFRCAICFNVMKHARMCLNQHSFCRECIEEHLRVNAQRCPQCQERLTVATLHPARVINNMISKLMINCDFAIRGCKEFINVEDLERHVENCGFAPVSCSNERCDKEINKRDKIKHETELCKYRKIPSHDFEEIKEMFQQSFENQVNEKMKQVKAEMDKKLVDVCVTKEMTEMKVMMIQILEKMTKNEHVKTLPSSIEGIMNSGKEDILIASGYPPGSKKSAEVFSWKEKKWCNIASMENDHAGDSFFIYNDNLFAVGHKSMETLNIKQSPLTWKTYPTVFPYVCWSHQTVVCKQQIFHIGGYIVSTTKSDMIYEIKITGTTSLVVKELCRMPEERSLHEAVVVHDKVLIFGGHGGHGKHGKVLSSVLEFDPRTLKFKEMPPLPHPRRAMAAVQWRDQVIFLGGYDGREYLNSVIMYDSKTGNITVLPSMLEKRSHCCAVITGDTIVVMGGKNDKTEYNKSVECFKMGSSSSWAYLPSMNESRYGATAAVLPFGQNYV